MSIRHFFAGVNSPLGFYSCFQSIIDQEKAERIIYIKGGPGTGKSTLLKKIASKFDDMGEPVEVFHCSSDPQSLDGVHIVNHKIALMDSTAPHIMEPKYPKVNGELFNAADCLNRGKLLGKEKELQEYCAVKEASFSRGFSYLKAAAPIMSVIDEIYDSVCDLEKVYKVIDNIIGLYLSKPSQTGNGIVRPLFLNAITPDGSVNYLDGLYEGNAVVTIKGSGNLQTIFTRLIDHTVRNGYDVETFYCPLNPKNKIEHIHMPELKLWISSYNDFQHSNIPAPVEVNDYSNLDRLKKTSA